MQVKRRFMPVVAAAALMAMAGSASAAWSLNGDASRLNFVSIKKDTIAEIHTFKQISGALTAQGDATITIELASVDTAVAIRDERMRDMLFETKLFPKAQISAKVDMARFSKLAAGEMVRDELEFTLDLHGQSKKLRAAVTAVKLQGDGFMVTTVAPVIIDAADFALVKGIEALKSSVGLPSISTAVPVTLSLVFDKSK